MPKKEPLPKIFMTSLEAHLDKLRASLDEQKKKHDISYKVGPKYVKVIDEYPNTSVVHFIEIASGAILKAAGWSRPAKGVRGNIFNERTTGGYYYYRR